MSVPLIQAKYEELTTIANRFSAQSKAQADLQNQLKRAVQPLQQGGWQGQGSAAFFAEMNGKIFPAMRRLGEALEQAQTVTLEIKEIMERAEEEAASPFRSNGDNSEMRLNLAGSSPNLNLSMSANFNSNTQPRSHVDTINVDQKTQLLNLIEWGKSMLESGNLTPEQRNALEHRVREAEAALAYAAQENGGNQYFAAAGVMVLGSGALLADDATVVGVVDDVIIPFALVTAAAVGLWGLFHEWTKDNPADRIRDAIIHMAESNDSSSSQSQESKDFLDHNEPQSWEGKDPQEVEDAIPKDWVKSSAKKGGGTKYSNPGRPGEQVIIEPGWPNATDPVHGGPYVKISKGGKVIRIPLKGNPGLGGQ